MCIHFSLCSTREGLKRPGLVLAALSSTKQRDWGEGSLKGTVTLNVSSLRRLEEDRGKIHTMSTYSHLAGGGRGTSDPWSNAPCSPAPSVPPPPGSQLSLMPGPSLALLCPLLISPRTGLRVFVTLCLFSLDEGFLLGQTLREFL